MLRQHAVVPVDEKLDIVTVARVLLEYRWTVLITGLVVAILAAVYALLATPIFKAEVTVTVVHDKGDTGTEGLAGEFGGLASLAGVNLGTSYDEQQAKAVLMSRYLIQLFIDRYRLIPALSGTAPKPLTLWKAVNRFHDRVLNIRDDQRKGVTVVTIHWTDPTTAARWANDFVALANEQIRTKALNDSQRNVDYLTQQTAKTSSVDVQRALYALIESETKKLMLANERTEYAFSIADPAVSPEIRDSPRRTLLVGIGLLLGLFLGASIAFVRSRFAAAREQAAEAAA